MNTKTIITTMASMAFCTTGAFAADPKLAPDNAWVSVYGEVTSLTPETFDLKYESGEVTVEFDHRYYDENAYKLVVGDKVTVTGMIDDSLFEERTIEASTAYVHSINTYYYATAPDEGDYSNFTFVGPPIDGMDTIIQGTVIAVPGDNKFQMKAGSALLTVETDKISSNPLKDEGYQKIETGDRLSVAGKFDKEFIEGYKLAASSIVTLSKNR